MDSLKKNHMHDLVKLLNGKKTLKNKWLFRLKQEDNSQSRYKARLVVKGFNNKKKSWFRGNIPVKMSSIRVVLEIEASLNLKIEHLNVKIVFLHENLEEELYMKQPEDSLKKAKRI